MKIKSKIQICIISNFFLLCIIIIFVLLLNDGKSKYFRAGWYDDLILVSIPINTRTRYIAINIFIAIIKIIEVAIQEIANPILGFNIYNPDKKVITEFTKNELQVYGNTMYLIESFKKLIMLMISITQIDLALISMLSGEITSLFTIRHLLNEKIFKISNENEMKNVEEIELLV